MILGSLELDNFVVEPWMELKPFDSKLIKKILRNHPYKILLWVLYKYSPSYNSRGNDANPNYDGYEDVTDFYFSLLDDYNRYGIAFERNYELFPGNKLGVIEYEEFGKREYYLVNNYHDKKILLFNKVKTIDLNEYERGEKPLTEEEKQKRDMIKKQTNKKLQVALMDPDVYHSVELIKLIIKDPSCHIEKFNHRMKYYGIEDFLKIEFD